LFSSLAERACWRAQEEVQERDKESGDKTKVGKTNQFVKKYNF